ncbi:asparagine synthetase B [Micromonospora sp. HUAS LYJ1]|uniref:asparagine synthetase B family protein n=1 Tax=Micromonospora sp. HUAS LYJ1 TaxID=3061626 RepID=UPI002671798C|nr:asparagine synthetase B [Micromonospora sp. HUAS LYJ1]WKU05083.1 asparagine synthetase B [Micromonospora sp. HUAS LYJ1]
MCGICGVVRPTGIVEPDLRLVSWLNDRQRHRGPDAADRWAGATVALGQTRLAVVDLTDAGRQPFVSRDGQIRVVFNGEIYNHGELRRRYRLTHVGRCDGAILPDLWALLGTDMFRQLRGMFAIAVEDGRDDSLTLARDPFGVKPLYWTRTDDGALAFASECRPLAGLHPRLRLSTPAIRQYLMFGAVDRDESPYAGIAAVPANAWIRWDSTLGCRTGPLHDEFLGDLPDATPADMRAEFLRSVSLHLTSDVPVALLLSAGLDSAAVAWAGREIAAELVCVTVDPSGLMGEQAGARRVATRYGHRHEVVARGPDEQTVAEYFSAMQRPSIDGLNTFLVSRAIAGLGLKVALSGLGGDEMLAGYGSFRALRRLPLLRITDRLPMRRAVVRACAARNEKLALLLGADGPRDAAGMGELFRRVLSDRQLATLGVTVPPPLPRQGGRPDASALALSRHEIQHYLGRVLLPDADAFSMASSVELRVPYVDVPFARQALAVAPERGVGKRGFAAALDDPELRRIAGQAKKGFTLPMDRWMRTGPLAASVRSAMSADAPVRSLLRPEAVDGLLADWRDGRSIWSKAWTVVALDGWLRSFPAGTVESALPETTSSGSLR